MARDKWYASVIWEEWEVVVRDMWIGLWPGSEAVSFLFSAQLIKCIGARCRLVLDRSSVDREPLNMTAT